MKISMFHLMPYRDLPDDFEKRYHSVWVDPPFWDLTTPEKAGLYYNQTLDELIFAAKAGMDGVCVNEHHQNAYGNMPGPNLMGSVLARATAGMSDMSDAQMDMQIQIMWSAACTGKFVWPIPDKGLKKRIHRIRAPTLIIWGRQDGIVPPAYADEFASRIANARVELIDNAGHLPQMEQLDVVSKLVSDFLER